MKCQKCGINEVNFRYSSNVNGCVAETHLCSKCAAESGYDLSKLFDPEQSLDIGSILNGLFPVQGGIRGFMPMAIPVFKSGAFFPVAVQSQPGMTGQNESCNCGCETGTGRQANIEVDEDMKVRRELNAQMRTAVENEEFELAASLRDQIKALQEAGGNEKCDSETISQDSPAAQ